MRHILPQQSIQAILASFEAIGLNVSVISNKFSAQESVSSESWGVVAGVEALTTLWTQARQQSKEPYLFVRAGLAVPFGSFGLVDHLTNTAPTLGEGLLLLQKYLPLISSTTVLTFVPEGDEIELQISNRPYFYPIHDWVDQWLLGMFVQRHRGYAARLNESLLTATFLRTLQEPDPVLDQIVGLPVTPNPLYTGMKISMKLWDTPTLNSDSVLHQSLLKAAEELMYQRFAKAPLAYAVWNTFSETLAAGQSISQAVAAQLGISARTLQRRLKKEKLSLSELIDTYRKQEAMRMVSERMASLGEISASLGYNEQSSFNRSFKRWTGDSPRGWLDKILGRDNDNTTPQNIRDGQRQGS